MKNSATSFARAAAPAAALARSRSRKKRFLITGTAALAVIAVVMGVSFLDSSGTASLTISQSSSTTLVYPLTYAASGTTSLPTTDPLTTTAFSGKTTVGGSGTCTNGAIGSGGATTGYALSSCTSVTNTINDSAIVNPSWSPVAGSAGTVTSAGDLALVDATQASNYVTVNMYIANLSALAIDYSSFALPINVYKTTCSSDGNCGAWQEELTSPSYTYITDTSGALTFNLPKGYYYDIVMEGTNHTTSNAPANSPTTGPSTAVGGSFYTTQTNGSGGSLSPSFYFTASAS